MFTVATWLAKINVTDWSAVATALETWFMWTELNDIPSEEYSGRLYEYHRLSQEGVQKKSNRLARFDILTQYLQETLGGQPQGHNRPLAVKYSDSSVLNSAESYEIDYWAKALGVTDQELRDAVAKIGPSINELRKELSKKNT